MKFDILKVIYIKVDKTLSSNIELGTKGYFGNDIAGLRYRVENEDKNYYGELYYVNARFDYSFYFIGKDSGYIFFYPVELPGKSKEKKYRPYTWEEREQLRGKCARYKRSFRKEEFIINNYFENSDGEFIINDLPSERFLEICEWIDGTPCGVLVEDGEE